MFSELYRISYLKGITTFFQSLINYSDMQVHISKNGMKLLDDRTYGRKVIQEIIRKKDLLEKGEAISVKNEKTNEETSFQLASTVQEEYNRK